MRRLGRRHHLDDFPFPPSLANLVTFDDDPRTHLRLHGHLLQANNRLWAILPSWLRFGRGLLPACLPLFFTRHLPSRRRQGSGESVITPILSLMGATSQRFLRWATTTSGG
jgi:hypothetical protein